MKTNIVRGNNILIKYMGPTNTRGARWRVQDTDKQYPAKTYPRDHALSPEEDAARVAMLYANDMSAWQWANSMLVASAGPRVYVVIPLEGE